MSKELCVGLPEITTVSIASSVDCVIVVMVVQAPCSGCQGETKHVLPEQNVYNRARIAGVGYVQAYLE